MTPPRPRLDLARMANTFCIGSLKIGTRVVIIGLENYYKNIEIVYSNDCGCAVKGYHKVDGTFKALGSNFTISNSTPVRIATEEDIKNLNDNQNLKTEEQKTKSEEKEKIKLIKELAGMGLDFTQYYNIAPPAPIEDKKTSDADFVLPKGEFTVKDAASLNSVSVATAYLNIKKNDRVFCVGERASKRGRATKIYKFK